MMFLEILQGLKTYRLQLVSVTSHHESLSPGVESTWSSGGDDALPTSPTMNGSVFPHHISARVMFHLQTQRHVVPTDALFHAQTDS